MLFKNLSRSLAIILVISLNAFAQDPQRSQYYAIPMELNPAYVGTSKFFSAFINYRVQYPSLENEFISYNFSGDYHIKNTNSGIGLSINDDNFGDGIVRSSSFATMFSTGVELNQKYSLRFGLKAGLIVRSIGFSDLIYADQLDASGNVSGPSSENFEDFGRKTMASVGSGAVLFHENYWVGIAGDHLNNPDQSFITNESKLPAKIVFHGGYKFAFINANGRVKKGLKEVSLSPMMQYKLQGPSHQWDIGAHLIAEPVIFGVWYRGIPLPSFERSDILNQDAIIFIAGLKMDEFRFSYSYDLGIGPLYNSNGGAHEITLSLRFGFYKWGIIKSYPKMLPMPIL
ncbi:MAG: PorP/SprF family type IX secretion system membrane protein [Cytophagales bacterium]